MLLRLRTVLSCMLVQTKTTQGYIESRAQPVEGYEQGTYLNETRIDLPTLSDLKEASVSFFQQMTASGFGHVPVVVFGAASLRQHFPNFRPTPVSRRTEASPFTSFSMTETCKDVDINIYEPDELSLSDMLMQIESGSGGKITWNDDGELLYLTIGSGRKIFMDADYVSFAV